MTEILLALFVGVFALLPARARAGDSCGVGAAEVVAGLQRHYDGTDNWQADFLQETSFAALGKREESRGVVSFKKPGRMRWEYTGGDERLIVSDGSAVWLYEPAERQVVKLRLESAFASAAPYALLTGVARLDRDFEARIVEASCGASRIRVRLRPRGERGGEGVTLDVERSTFAVTGIETIDGTGNVTRITFQRINPHADIPASLFQFEPPPGVDVVTPPGA